MIPTPFCPHRGGTLTIAIAATASAAQALGDGRSRDVSLFNSGTAIAFVRVDVLPTVTDTGGLATTADFPVPPGARLVISPGVGFKSISVIGSAANGNLYATPGHGGT